MLTYAERSSMPGLSRRCISSMAVPAALIMAVAISARAQTPTPVPPSQPGGNTAIESIVVTAEKRPGNIQKTPLALSTVSARALDLSFVTQVSGLNGLVPSLEITQASGFENLVSIRGVGSETPENALTTVPGVSEFIDGVYIANTVSLDQTLFDIDHIEVLRGPQGALYGQSSIGGAINILTKQPVLNQISGGADVSGGTYDLTRERGDINIPVGETIAVRAAIEKFDDEGFTRDIAIPNFRLDQTHDINGKIAILWKPADNFSATLTGQWYSARENGSAQKNILDPDPSPRVVDQDYPSLFALRTQLYHLNLQYDAPWFTIKSVSAYQGLNNTIQEDSSRLAFAILHAYDDVGAWNTKVANYNEDFEIQSLTGSVVDWTAGAFVLNQASQQFVAEFECAPSAYVERCSPPTASELTVQPTIESAPPGNLDYGNDEHVERRSYAGFAQATTHILPDLRATLGGRYNIDTYTQDSFSFSAFGDGTVRHAYTDHVPTGRFDLDWDVTADDMLYASVARGYKPGGVNGTYGQYIVPATFSPETNTAFELGSKNSLLDHALRLNLAAYYYFYRNMQYIETDPVPFDGGMANIPSIHAYGLEAEANYATMQEHLHINASLALENAAVIGTYRTIDSTLAHAIEGETTPPCAYGGGYNTACDALVVAGAANIRGNTPPDMPKVSGSINASYIFDIPTGTLTPRAEYVYRGAEWARVFDVPNLDRVKAYGVVNLNLTYVPTGTRWTVSLTATNLFNVDGINSKYTDPYGTGQTSIQYISPLQVIGSLGYRF